MTGTRSTKYQKVSKRTTLGTKEKRRLIQLLICLGLFFTVLLGKGLAPEGIMETGEKLLQMIRTDTDFESAFSAVGETVSDGGSVWDGLSQLATEVFGVTEQDTLPAGVKLEENGPAVKTVRLALTRVPTKEVILADLGVNVSEEETGSEAELQEETPEPEPSAAPTPSPTPEPTPQVTEYAGPALPDGATMEKYDLGLTNTVTPIFGVVSSAYGYRDHPVDGEYVFHTGVDLAADTGTPVESFADGTVDFIGESEVYGLYIQLNHGNGVTTFYCHCSELLARKGDEVSAGQIIAKVGNTGNATGAHLHLEMKKDGVLLNPLYYIEVES